VVTRRILANAAYIEAASNLRTSAARSREIRAKAIRGEIANSVAYTKAFWETKAINESERMKRYKGPLERRKIGISKTWERLRDLPELNGPAIIEGRAMNFLLDRLSGSVLAYRFSLHNQEPNAALAKQLVLPPDTINKLQLRQRLTGGRELVFRADEGTALRDDWWPSAVRGKEFESLRASFSKDRQVAVREAQATKQISNEALKELMKSLDRIDAAVHRKYDRNTRFRSISAWADFKRAERFIQTRAGEIRRMQETGTAEAFDGSLKFKGGDLIALLTHMSRSGLDFAPAQPGDEAAYQGVFHMMRDLYLTVADQ